MPESGSGPERLAELRRRLEEDPQSPVFLQLAEEYRRLGQTEQSLKVLEEGLRRNPNYLSAQVAHARCLLDLGRTSLAVPALEQVLGKDPTQLVARKLLVEAFIRQGQAMRARRELDLYITLNAGDPEVAGLRSRIEDLQLADLVPPSRLVPPPIQRPTSVTDRLVPPPSTKEISVANESSEDGPFQGLPRPASSTDFLRQLTAEGIFSLGQSVQEPLQAFALPVVEIEEDSPVWTSTLAPENDLSPVDRPDIVTAPTFVAQSETPAVTSPSAPALTATLGQLYLSQGHLGEAERIFREVLAEDPGNQPALQGLVRLDELSTAGKVGKSEGEAEGAAESPSQAVPVNPRSLAASLTEKKVRVLNRYLAGLRSTAGRHVS